MIGASPAELDAAAAELTQAADFVDESGRALSTSLGSLSWAGQAALAFSDRWSTQHKPRLVSSSQFLRDRAAELRAQARQQLAASEGGSSSGTAGGAAAAIGGFAPPAVARAGNFLTDRLGWTSPKDRDVADPGAKTPKDMKPSDLHLEKDRFRRVPLFRDGIKPSDVVQGQLGDCYLLSALAAMASTESGRRTIEGMITDNGDRTFTVHFSDGTTVTVDDDLWCDRDGSPAYAQVRGDLWPAILEKAWAERFGQDFAGIDGAAVAGNGSNFRSQAVIAAFGYQFVTSDLTNMPDAADYLSRAAASGQPLTMAADLHDFSPSEPVGSGHEFSVIGNWTDDHGVRMLTIRNPWGSNSGLTIPGATMGKDGTFTMTVDAAAKAFEVARAGQGQWEY